MDAKLKRGWWVLPLVAALVIGLDQWTKRLVEANLGLYETWAAGLLFAQFLCTKHLSRRILGSMSRGRRFPHLRAGSSFITLPTPAPHLASFRTVTYFSLALQLS